MKRVLCAALLCGVSSFAYADGMRVSMAPFQSSHAWQTNWDNLVQRGNAAGAQWDCRGSDCDMYFIIKPGVKAHLAQQRYGRGYCYIIEGDTTADCYRQDGKKTVWTLDKPFDYGLTSAPAYVAPPVVAQAPVPDSTRYVPSAGGSDAACDVVASVMVGHSIHINVNVGGTPVDMILDTGAEISSISTSLADTLIASGQATEAAPVRMTMADGSKHFERTIVVKTMTVGNHVRYNVHVSVSDGMALLGLPVLNAIGKFTIDSAHNQLTFG